MPGTPDRGSIGWLNFDPQEGREQGGRRPCLVLSPDPYNGRVGLALVCPITSKQKGYPFEEPLPDELKTTGVVLCDQVRSLDWRGRRYEHIEDVSEDFLKQVIEKIRPLLEGE